MAICNRTSFVSSLRVFSRTWKLYLCHLLFEFPVPCTHLVRLTGLSLLSVSAIAHQMCEKCWVKTSLTFCASNQWGQGRCGLGTCPPLSPSKQCGSQRKRSLEAEQVTGAIGSCRSGFDAHCALRFQTVPPWNAQFLNSLT